MKVKTAVKKIKENKVELTVEVPAEQFSQSIGQAYRAVSKKAKIPGFRAGKIPARIIDSYFGKGYVLKQALDQDLPKYYSEAIQDSGIRPINKPDIEILALEENKDLKFKAQVEVEPEVRLPDFKELSAKFEKPKTKPEDIEAQINVIRNRFAELKTASSKAAEEGDHVLINFDGMVDGKPFEGGSAQNYLLEIDSNTFLPEFEKQLVTSKAGDIKNIIVTLPLESPNKEIAGKKANFKVLVKEVKVKKLPDLTDKFVKEVAGFETVSELKKEIKKDLQKAVDRQADTQYKMALLKQLAEKTKMNIPPVMVDNTTEEMIEEFKLSLKNQGTNLENYLKATKTSEKDLRKNLRGAAEERTREQLAIKTLIEKEKLSVSDKELDEEIEKSSKDKEKAVTRKELEEKGLMGYLKSNIIYRKALDFLVKKTQEEAKQK